MKTLKTILRILAFLLIIVVGGYLGFSGGSVVAEDASQTDPSAPWVRGNGSIDMSRLPECFTIVDEKGATVLDESGNEVCVPSSELFGPPTEEDLQRDTSGDKVTINPDGSITIETEAIPAVELYGPKKDE